MTRDHPPQAGGERVWSLLGAGRPVPTQSGYPKGSEPVSTDPIDQLLDSRDDLDRAVQHVEAATVRRTAAAGRDASGQVTVRTDGEGDILDVILATNWHAVLSTEQLGAAVVEAYHEAGVAAAREWGARLADSIGEPEPRVRPLPRVADSLGARLDEVVNPERLAERTDASLAALHELLEQLLHDVDRVSADTAQLVAQSFTGDARGARVTVSGTGHLLRVGLDPQWAAGTTASSICRFVLTAYRQARRQARARSVEELLDESSLGELQRLARDPRALAERLRLL